MARNHPPHCTADLVSSDGSREASSDEGDKTFGNVSSGPRSFLVSRFRACYKCIEAWGRVFDARDPVCMEAKI